MVGSYTESKDEKKMKVCCYGILPKRLHTKGRFSFCASSVGTEVQGILGKWIRNRPVSIYDGV